MPIFTPIHCIFLPNLYSSSKNGFYKLTTAGMTWHPWCRMSGITECGDGAWTEVMRIDGSKVFYSCPVLSEFQLMLS